MANAEESPAFELGDRIYIEGGQLDGTRGRIYYMDAELIRILPEGAPDRVIDIPLVDGDFSEELGIDTFYLLSKRANPAFVAQIDAHVGELADTFGPDGKMGVQYMIKEVNEEEDFVILDDNTGGELRLDFNFTGIPQDVPFVVLRPRQPLERRNGNQNQNANADEANTAPEAQEEDDFFKDIDVGPEEEEEVEGLVERPVTQRIYPDRVQRDEMFRNILEARTILEQKNPRVQKEIRQFVEQCMLMRNTVVEYNSAGDPIGRIPTSFQTIAELLKSADIPLARPVMTANRTLYLDLTEDINPTELPGVAVNLKYLQTVVHESNQYLDTQLGGAAGMLSTPDALPQWFLTWEAFFGNFMRTWTSGGGPGDRTRFEGDKEFLRAPIPDGLNPVADGLPYPSLEPLTSDIPVTADAVGTVTIALQKGLGPRSTRLKNESRRIESGDEGVIINQLLFPLKTQRDLGLTRSGVLAKDIQFSEQPSRTLRQIFKSLEGIPDEPTTGGILSVGPEGNTLGNIGIDDWLKTQPLRIRGLGDALVEIKNMGLTQKELTSDQQDVLIDKVKQLRAIVVGTILKEHNTSEQLRAALRLENRPFLEGEALEDLMATLSSEPQIQPIMEHVQTLLPAYKDNDIAIVAGICASAADLFLTAMAGVPGPLARERNRKSRDTFLETLRQTLLKVIKRENTGQEPQPINCPHTKSLQQIRKVRDHDDRMKLFAKFLARFQGPRKDNWIICAASARGQPHNLVCYHEVLLLQEYLHPKEKDVIHKELLLAFSGGVFHGRYICKNCGQPISQMDFDQSIEFDDQGRPMSGRAVLVDKDEIESDEFRLLLGAPSEKDAAAEFANETQALIYSTARQIFDTLGIYAEKDSYAHIIERVDSELAKQPSREDYARMIKARAKTGEGKPLDYDVLINRIIVSAVAAHSLIEIQTHVPDFVVRTRLPGCVAGFGGFPLGREEDKTGVNYMSCAVSAIKRNEAPWNLTGFLLQSNEKKRQEMIAAAVFKLAADAMKTAAVQQLVSVKRAYYEKVYGTTNMGSKLPEAVIPRFRPEPYYITPEEATQNIVIPAAATNADLARVWIQTAHRIARENGNFVRGSPFAETSSCFTPIGDADGFWKGKAMPALQARAAPRGQSGSQVALVFKPRRMKRLLADAPEELFYRVFLRVCYDGPHKGLPHEPGYTHKCMYCGFAFPDDPYGDTPAPPLIKDLYNEWKSEMDGIITKGKSALEAQKVAVNKDTFQDILDTTHTKFRVTVADPTQPLAGGKLFERLLTMEPPFEGWQILMADTIERVAKMPPNPDQILVADAYGPMSDFVARGIEDLERRVGESSVKAIRAIFNQSPSQVVESVRTYFLVPFQRLLVDFHADSLKVSKSYGLPVPTRDDADRGLREHLAYMTAMKKHVTGYAKMKLEEARNSLARTLPVIQNELRANLIPGGAQAIPYLVTTLILGILEDFINPNIVPTGTGAMGGAYEPTARVPLSIVENCLARYQLEALAYSDEQIRDMIARRVEAEKMTFINRLDRLSPEEKKVELMKKRLGLGEWAVGGTKAIFSLDPDQYERERVQRIEMGLGDFVTDAVALGAAAMMINDDNFGGGGMGAESGYDNQQMDADDY